MRNQDRSSELTRKRVRRIQNEIIGNESLGGDSLDEAGARELLSFGLISAEGIASATDGMDDDAAELTMTDRLKALRKLMRHLGRLLGEGNEMDADGRLWLWDNVQKNARAVYGENLIFPDLEDVMRRLSSGETPGRIIASLRDMFEDQKTE